MNFESSDPRQTLRLQVARHILGLSKSWELKAVADRALAAGLYSNALAELATVDEPIMSDVGPLFERAIVELGETIPQQLDAAFMLTRYCMEQIVQPASSPVDILQFLWWKLKHHDAVPRGTYVGEGLDMSALMGIYDCYGEPSENFYKPERRLIHDEAERMAILDREARAEAREWLQRHPI